MLGLHLFKQMLLAVYQGVAQGEIKGLCQQKAISNLSCVTSVLKSPHTICGVQEVPHILCVGPLELRRVCPNASAGAKLNCPTREQLAQSLLADCQMAHQQSCADTIPLLINRCTIQLLMPYQVCRPPQELL